MNRAELKTMAKEHIKGNLGVWFLINLICYGISYLLSLIPYVGSFAASIVVAPIVSIVTMILLLNQAQGMKPEIAELFRHFDKWFAAFKVTFLTGLFTFLWSLLLVIPGIVKSYSYSMAMYILAENPDMSAREAIDRSKNMMNGHKMDLFVLHLSFIGWNLLAMLTVGILYIWLLPYMNATVTNFYNSIKNQPVVE